MASSSRMIGLTFWDGGIQLAEVERGKKPTVTAIAETEGVVDFVSEAANLSASHAALPGFIKAVGALMKAGKTEAAQISFALPSEALFAHIIPFDASLKDEQLRTHLQWETGQFIDGDPASKDFIIGSTSIQSTLSGAKQLLLVCVRRGIVGFLQKVCTDLKLERKIVDIDHLSVEKSIKYNYPEVKNYPAALMGVRSRSADVSLLWNGETIDMRSYSGTSDAELVKAAVEYVRSIKQRDAERSPAALFLYGNFVSREMRKRLGDETNVQTVQINAFRKLNAPKKADPKLVEANHRFAAALGLAMREN